MMTKLKKSGVRALTLFLTVLMALQLSAVTTFATPADECDHEYTYDLQFDFYELNYTTKYICLTCYYASADEDDFFDHYFNVCKGRYTSGKVLTSVTHYTGYVYGVEGVEESMETSYALIRASSDYVESFADYYGWDDVVDGDYIGVILRTGTKIGEEMAVKFDSISAETTEVTAEPVTGQFYSSNGYTGLSAAWVLWDGETELTDAEAATLTDTKTMYYYSKGSNTYFPFSGYETPETGVTILNKTCTKCGQVAASQIETGNSEESKVSYELQFDLYCPTYTEDMVFIYMSALSGLGYKQNYIYSLSEYPDLVSYTVKTPNTDYQYAYDRTALTGWTHYTATINLETDDTATKALLDYLMQLQDEGMAFDQTELYVYNDDNVSVAASVADLSVSIASPSLSKSWGLGSVIVDSNGAPIGMTGFLSDSDGDAMTIYFDKVTSEEISINWANIQYSTTITNAASSKYETCENGERIAYPYSGDYDYDQVTNSLTILSRTVTEQSPVMETCVHDYDDGVVTTKATCIEDGSMTYTCSDCGFSYTTSIEATGHTAGTAVKENVVAATCTKDGSYDSVVYCETCGEELSRETVTVSKTGHTANSAVTENYVAATCTKSGSYDTVTYCKTCGAEMSRVTTTVAATGHNYTSSVTKAATCTTAGTRTYTCSKCGDSYTESIPATGHTYTSSVTKAATCTTAGTRTYTCSCGDTYTESIPATGHNYTSSVTKAATCTTAGTRTYTCSRCGDSYSESIPATGHNWNDGVVTTAATHSSTGVKTYTCTVCGATKTETIAKVSFLFDDVKDSSAYYYDAVYWAYDNGITKGTSDTLFSPSADCTRAQFVTFLWRLAGSPELSSSNNPFTDVTNTSASYYKAVLWAAENGVTEGTTSTTFSPSVKITRAQAVTMLYRYAGSPSVSTTNPFTDTSSSAYYYNAMLWAVKNGITSGTTKTTFSPNTTCSRAMMVTFLYRFAG